MSQRAFPEVENNSSHCRDPLQGGLKIPYADKSLRIYSSWTGGPAAIYKLDYFVVKKPKKCKDFA